MATQHGKNYNNSVPFQLESINSYNIKTIKASINTLPYINTLDQYKYLKLKKL